MWEATYSEEGNLKQYDNHGEHLFSEINLNKLTTFSIYNTDLRGIAPNEILLDLKSGKFFIKDQCFDFGYSNVKKRLIYFRRTKQTLGGAYNNEDVVEHIGWQATVDGRNVKRVICFKNGEIYITCD